MVLSMISVKPTVNSDTKYLKCTALYVLPEEILSKNSVTEDL